MLFRYGIRAFDTSPYYGPSEIVLGTALKTLAPEFPRQSYKLMTKCGRYGATPADFDYSPSTIRTSVQRSLTRFNTDYLDVVYLHDVEFVCTPVLPRASGNHLSALGDEKEAYGTLEGQEGKLWGSGDQIVLDAFAELKKLKEEGLVRAIGITGYPLPTLLRLALLIAHHSPDQPVDVILSYSHLNLQNSSLINFVQPLVERARVKQVITASPFNMGLLTNAPPVPWHPASPALKAAVLDAAEVARSWPGTLPNLALGYAIRESRELNLPLVAGFSVTREVHENVAVWREVEAGENRQTRVEMERKVLNVFEKSGHYNESWASP